MGIKRDWTLEWSLEVQKSRQKEDHPWTKVCSSKNQRRGNDGNWHHILGRVGYWNGGADENWGSDQSWEPSVVQVVIREGRRWGQIWRRQQWDW